MVRVSILLAVIVGCAAATARADSAAAKLHYEAGTTAYNIGDFLTAAKEYTAAYRAKPEPVLLYNTAQAYRLGGDLKQAAFFYRSYLRNVPDAANRQEVEERIRALDAEIAAHHAAQEKPPTAQPATSSPASPSRAEATAPAVKPVPPAVKPVPPAAYPAAPAAAVVAAMPAPTEHHAHHSHAWVWGVVAGVAAVGVGLGVGLGLGLTRDNAPPAANFPNSPVF